VREQALGARLAHRQNTMQQPLAPHAQLAPTLQGGGSEANRGSNLALAKSLATGQRDKSLPAARQAGSELGARAGQAVGGVIGSAVPVVGSAVGQFIGKRAGRLAVGRPLLFIALTAFSIFLSVLPYLLIGFFVIYFISVIGIELGLV
jgi:hypothetical protein